VSSGWNSCALGDIERLRGSAETSPSERRVTFAEETAPVRIGNRKSAGKLKPLSVSEISRDVTPAFDFAVLFWQILSVL